MFRDKKAPFSRSCYYNKSKGKGSNFGKGLAVVAVAAASALAITAVIIPSSAYADQSATYATSSGSVTISGDCTKDPTDPYIDCKQYKEFFGANPNQFAREECEALSGGEPCHRQK